MIEAVSEKNRQEVLPLIREYQAFYGVSDGDEERNRTFFAQFGENSPFGCQFAYRSDGEIVGFATVFLTFSSTIASKVAVMNDVYTRPSSRGKGVGRCLIERCQVYAKAKDATRLQWLTAPDNVHAQALYDALDTKKSLWTFYTLDV